LHLFLTLNVQFSKNNRCFFLCPLRFRSRNFILPQNPPPCNPHLFPIAIFRAISLLKVRIISTSFAAGIRI